MGGSGGGFYRGADSFDFGKKFRKSEQESIDKEFVIKVSKLLAELLAKYNDRDVDATSKHLETIKAKIEKELETSVNLVFSGSVARHTYINGFSDVDALLVIDNSNLIGSSPEKVRFEIGKLIQERFPKTNVKVGSQAITIDFHDQKIQILPSIKTKSGFKISDESGKVWSNIKPKEFAVKLTDVNRKMDSKLVPTIKLIKSIVVQNDSSKISGYHAESLAIDIFKTYKGEKTVKSMLKHFFDESSSRVLKPVRDRSGREIGVDEALGPENSLNRRIIANSFNRISKRMNNADGSQNIEMWKKLLGANE